MVIVLDKGIIDYGISLPGHMEVAGTLAPLCDEEFRFFPIYVSMIIHKDCHCFFVVTACGELRPENVYI